MPRKAFRSRVLVLFVVLVLTAFAAGKFVSYAKKGVKTPAAPALTTVTDTQSDATTGNNDTKLQAGEKEEGVVTVAVTGSNQTFSSLSIPIDSHLTLDNTFGNGAGFTVTPIVQSTPSYNAIG